MGIKSFNNFKRDRQLQEAEKIHFDVIVIGGGITGAGIIFDATLRGLKVLLLEKSDFASGTSSKSTKLIHGGLRYLKQLNIGLVRESGLERAIAHKNIPHLVHPEKMLLPIVKNGSFGKLSASLAIAVYDRLANVHPKDRKVNLSKDDTIQKEPLLNTEILKSSIVYSEYRTDDAKLTVELIKAAIANEGLAFNYAEVKDFTYSNGTINGVTVKDNISEKAYTFQSKIIVSAAGPWVDELRKKNKSLSSKGLHLTKGVHIVVPHQKLPIKQAIYFDVFDGRMIFAIPRYNTTYIGTSDTDFQGNKDRILCTSTDAEYLLKATNTMFPNVSLKNEDIISSWAGVRPLIKEAGKSNTELSRKDEIFTSESGLISIAGGKLTGFRKMADRILEHIKDTHSEIEIEACSTANAKIHHNSFDNYDDLLKYIDTLKAENQNLDIPQNYIWYLCTTFGKDSFAILEKSKSNKHSSDILNILAEEIAYCINFEAAYFPSDYFNRRTGKLYFDILNLKDQLDFILKEFKSHFNWTDEVAAEMKNLSLEEINDVSVIK